MDESFPSHLSLIVAFVVLVGLGGVVLVDAVAGPSVEPSNVSVATLDRSASTYLGERVVVVGWYQGGAVRSKDPMCANTREGVQRVPYHLVYADVPENATLYTGVRYRFTGTVRPSVALNRTIPDDGPVFVVESFERLPEGVDGCP